MPRYDYACITCGRVFETTLAFGEPGAEIRCPSGHRRVRREYTATPIVFKGGGFYVTDHRRAPAVDGGKPAAASQ